MVIAHVVLDLYNDAVLEFDGPDDFPTLVPAIKIGGCKLLIHRAIFWSEKVEAWVAITPEAMEKSGYVERFVGELQ